MDIMNARYCHNAQGFHIIIIIRSHQHYHQLSDWRRMHAGTQSRIHNRFLFPHTHECTQKEGMDAQMACCRRLVVARSGEFAPLECGWGLEDDPLSPQSLDRSGGRAGTGPCGPANSRTRWRICSLSRARTGPRGPNVRCLCRDCARRSCGSKHTHTYPYS